MSACSSGSSVSVSARFIASQKRSPSNLSALARADLLPELRALVRLAELERALEVGNALVQVVELDRQVGRARKPLDRGGLRSRARSSGLVRPTRDRNPRAWTASV